MPCTYYTDSEIQAMTSAERNEAVQKLNKVTAMLCSVLDRIESSDEDGGMTTDDLPAEIYEWWQNHQKKDLERQVKEKEQRQAEKLRIKNEISNLKKKLKEIE